MRQIPSPPAKGLWVFWLNSSWVAQSLNMAKWHKSVHYRRFAALNAIVLLYLASQAVQERHRRIAPSCIQCWQSNSTSCIIFAYLYKRIKKHRTSAGQASGTYFYVIFFYCFSRTKESRILFKYICILQWLVSVLCKCRATFNDCLGCSLSVGRRLLCDYITVIT